LRGFHLDDREATMRYAIFFAIMLPIEFLTLLTVLLLVRRFSRRPQPETGGRLSVRVLLLMLLTSVLSLLPFGMIVGPIVYLVILKRLSGLDVLSTVMLSYCVGIPLFALSIYVGRVLQLGEGGAFSGEHHAGEHHAGQYRARACPRMRRPGGYSSANSVAGIPSVLQGQNRVAGSVRLLGAERCRLRPL